jgi:hypothetical protein
MKVGVGGVIKFSPIYLCMLGGDIEICVRESKDKGKKMYLPLPPPSCGLRMGVGVYINFSPLSLHILT